MKRIVWCFAAAPLLGWKMAPALADDAYTCSHSGDLQIAACSQFIAQNPRVAGGFNNRGNAYTDKGDYDRAIADFDQAIRLDPSYASPHNGRGNALSRKGEYDRAIADFDQAIRLDPNYAYPYNGRGSAYNDKGDYDRAIVNYDQATRLDPRSASAYKNRCAAYNNKKMHDRAMADCNQAILLDPKFAGAYDNRGDAWSGKGDYDRAIYDYDQAILLDPKAAYAYADRCSAYNNKKMHDRAMTDCNQAILLNPRLAAAYGNRGDAWSGKGDHDRAIYDYDQAILLNPKKADVYTDRGAAYEKKGDGARALADYEQSLRLDPNDASAREGRARLLAAVAASAAPAPSPRPAASPIAAERRVALVIGNSGYASSLVSALPNPRRDAKVVADALRQAGFETMELIDLGRDAMVKALQAFRARAAGADWALVYFAGHGIEINRVNYLIPVDAKLSDSGDVELETVSYEAVLNAVGGAKALRIIILDACRNNPYKANMHRTVTLRGNLDRGLAAPPETEPGTLVVYSAKEGQTAVDGDGVNSPFALAFVTRLKTPGREVQRMFDDVRDDVLAATGKRQQPYKYGSLPGAGDFFFVAGK
jgi:tetratricopeptide (TPR) repeat protein